VFTVSVKKCEQKCWEKQKQQRWLKKHVMKVYAVTKYVDFTDFKKTMRDEIELIVRARLDVNKQATPFIMEMVENLVSLSDSIWDPEIMEPPITTRFTDYVDKPVP